LPPADAGDFYELARLRAACSALAGRGKAALTAAEKARRQQDADLAVEALQQAVAAGYDDLGHLTEDAAIEPPRARANFKRLVGQLRAKTRTLVWVEDLEAAKLQAAKERKDLLLYFGGSDWSSFDVAFRKRMFGQREFVDYVAKHFVLVDLDSLRY